MFTCSVGDEVFESDAAKATALQERRLLIARCKKLEKDLETCMKCRSEEASKYAESTVELRKEKERAIHEMAAEHAVQLTEMQRHLYDDIERYFCRSQDLENELTESYETIDSLKRHVESLDLILQNKVDSPMDGNTADESESTFKKCSSAQIKHSSTLEKELQTAKIQLQQQKLVTHDLERQIDNMIHAMSEIETERDKLKEQVQHLIGSKDAVVESVKRVKEENIELKKALREQNKFGIASPLFSL
mmetsp:Transcript_14609/g.22023  ORF Transcript_14609/g.22023 Transcript_14609/m.22023 type:complete len:248 (+) Transcript_14609:244-987(+)|eukprot:CAMPEP_0185038516 /NCGR_PEP_ID=MMETSP1103-20130426/34260_1 /TAXON_ID=36769 /ORGANISM="Paraphysomonas bandaiensis, Strain Caron Lab Isolate" /LENGTH=247 /DNA_ID=CAMNT_0027576981 /DNA_START=218 /DNA_END=961 /DNA_ORIENTATION=-